MERYSGGKIRVVDYDPEWPRFFDEERARIIALIGPMLVALEHIGSTSVPGLAAKPIVDVLVGVRDLEEARREVVPVLQAADYRYYPEYESWLPDELFFRRGEPWTHHLHVMEPGNPRWAEFLVFRDYLRANPDEAAAYADLKRRLADLCGEDIAAYRTRKHDFIQAMKARAKERASRLGNPAA